MTDEEKAAAEAKAKADEAAKEKAKQDAIDKLKFLRDNPDDDEDDEDEDEETEEELLARRKRRRAANRQKKFFEDAFAPVKELLDEWSEWKSESNWTPKSKRTTPAPVPAEPSKTNSGKADGVFAGFSGKGGLWDL